MEYIYVKFRVPFREDAPDFKTIYGILLEDSTVREEFATAYPGVSDNCAGVVWTQSTFPREEISQEEFNAAFLNCDVDEMDEEDKTSTLDQLRAKYRVEE